MPAALGVHLGTGRRPLMFGGDGALEMAGLAIVQAPRRGLSPVVVFVDNGSWGILRPLTRRAKLLEFPPWRYIERPHAWGGDGTRVRTCRDLREGLRAERGERDFMIEGSIMQNDDLSASSRRPIGASARRPGVGLQ